MTNHDENPRLVSFLRIHACACREMRLNSPDESRVAELVEIIKNSEKEYPFLQHFRMMTRECRDINRIIDRTYIGA